MGDSVKGKEYERCMGPVQPSGPFLTLVACEWNSKFATRREEVDYGIENKVYVEARAELRSEENAETRTEPVEAESLVRAFMRARHESDMCADKVEAFCFGANLQSLQAEKGKGSEAVIAWLDERCFVGGKGIARTKTGPLTASGLYRELKKPRYRFGGPNIPSLRPCGRSSTTRNSNEMNSDPPNPNESQLPEEPDAERRLIFITDLDRWSIYALIGTASNYQAFALRDALYKHLAFENFIGVTFPPAGLAMFQLAFHLPYYAWRTSQKACEDHRRDANASPLRQSIDVTFLNSKSSGYSSFLYEAQISCVISGSDESRWVGYCFVDTYFEAEEVKETVQSYHEDSLADEGMLTDPFTLGERNANDPIQKPREYFLEVFRVRIDQVKCEWEQVVAKVQESIRKYIPTHHYSLALPRDCSSFEVSEDHDEKVRKSRDWVVQVRRLSKQLSQDLSKTVDACERFCRKYAVYFQNLPGSPDDHVHLSLAATQTTFDKLELLKKTLETLAERCDDFARDLELHLIIENIEVGNRQHKVSEDNKGLSVIMMLYISPIALTAAIFSMNENVMPFVPARFGSFVGLVFAFGILGVIIYIFQLYQTGCWQVILSLTGRRIWGKKTSGSYFEMLHFNRDFLWSRRKSSKIQGDIEQRLR